MYANRYQVTTEYGTGQVWAVDAWHAAQADDDNGVDMIRTPVVRVPQYDTDTAQAYDRLWFDGHEDTVWVEEVAW